MLYLLNELLKPSEPNLVLVSFPNLEVIYTYLLMSHTYGNKALYFTCSRFVDHDQINSPLVHINMLSQRPLGISRVLLTIEYKDMKIELKWHKYRHRLTLQNERK